MSDYLQRGQHPDPDSLNSFIEGVLPEHERLQCLAHLADCPACREVVYLAQEPLAPEPLPVPPPKRVPFWKRWLTPIPALSAAMATGILVLAVWFYQHHGSAASAPELVALERRAGAARAPLEYSLSESTPRKTIKEPVQPPYLALTLSRPPLPPVVLPPSAPPPSAPAAAPPAAAAPVAPLAPQRSAMLDAVRANDSFGSEPAISGIAGTVTDPAGAAIAGATVNLRLLPSSASRTLTSDQAGQFNVTGIEPGQYELQVSKPGFKKLTEQVDVQARQIAHVDSTLSLGSVSESISVMAETAPIMLSTSETALKDAVVALPSRMPPNMTVSKGNLMLATDSAGALFLSRNAGKKWSAVKPVWQGKVVNLVALSAPASSSAAAFQLTTTTGSVWLSRDGNRWYAAPAQK
jgi:carboxypeptidase family protein/putative zinc finger protein